MSRLGDVFSATIWLVHLFVWPRPTYFLHWVAELLLRDWRKLLCSINRDGDAFGWFIYLFGQDLHIFSIELLSCFWEVGGNYCAPRSTLWCIPEIWNYLVGSLHLFGQVLRSFSTLPTRFMECYSYFGWFLYLFGQRIRIFRIDLLSCSWTGIDNTYSLWFELVMYFVELFGWFIIYLAKAYVISVYRQPDSWSVIFPALYGSNPAIHSWNYLVSSFLKLFRSKSTVANENKNSIYLNK